MLFSMFASAPLRSTKLRRLAFCAFMMFLIYKSCSLQLEKEFFRNYKASNQENAWEESRDDLCFVTRNTISTFEDEKITRTTSKDIIQEMCQIGHSHLRV